jgi:hypothetical protein
MLCSLLFQSSIPARYWVEGLHTATYLLNCLPTKAISTTSPYFALHGVAPSYEHLRVFGCACYPNLSAKTAHKLAPRSTRCIFLGYSADHKGYRCLDHTTNNIVVSRHVVFDEVDFPFSASPRLTNDLDILLQDDSLGAAPMPAPLPTSHVPPGFPPLVAAGGPIASPGGPTALRTGAGGPIAQPCAAPPSPTSTASCVTPTTSAAAPASTTPAAPPVAPASQLYPLHYSRRPRATREPPAPPLHQQSPPAKAIPVAPPVNPHPMTTRVKRGFRPTDSPCRQLRRQPCRWCPPLSALPSSIQIGAVPWKKNLLP